MTNINTLFDAIKDSMEKGSDQSNKDMNKIEKEADITMSISETSFNNIKEQSEDSYIRQSDDFKVYDPNHGEFKFNIDIKYETIWSSDYEDYVNSWCLDSIIFEADAPKEVMDWVVEDIFNDYSVEYDIRELSFDEDYDYDELLEEEKVQAKRFTNDTNLLNAIVNYLNMGEISIPWKKELKDTGDITCRHFWSFAFNAKCEFENQTGNPFLEEVGCYSG